MNIKKIHDKVKLQRQSINNIKIDEQVLENVIVSKLSYTNNTLDRNVTIFIDIVNDLQLCKEYDNYCYSVVGDKIVGLVGGNCVKYGSSVRCQFNNPK